MGQGSTYLFIYLSFFILLLNYVAANAFGICNLRNTGKCDQLSDTCYCESLELRSHFKSRLSLIVRVNVVTVRTFSRTIKLNPCYCTHYININLFPSRCFPWHCLFLAMAWINALIQSHTMFYCSRMSLSMQPMQVHKLIIHQWKKLDLIKRWRCDQRKFLLIFI